MNNKFRSLCKKYLYQHETVFNILSKIGITFGVNKRTLDIIDKILDEQSLNPEFPRKSREIRKKEILDWLFKYGYINSSYNECGMDVIGFDKPELYVDHYRAHLDAITKFGFYRIKNSIVPRPIYAALSDDKFAFSSYLEKISLGSTPPVHLCILKGGKVAGRSNDFVDALFALKELSNGKYVLKPNLGQCGRNIIVMTVKDNELFFSDDIDYSYVKKLFQKEPYIVQEFVIQHEAMRLLNPSSVNTIRITTTRFNSEAHLFTAIVRIGVTNSLVDNAAAGGTCVGVDIETGKLMKYGYYHNRPKELLHPVSGIVYEGYQIPFWEEAVKLVKFLHQYFRGYPSIGWDVVITEKGPKIIENNYDWDFGIQQQIFGGLKKRWNDAKKLP